MGKAKKYSLKIRSLNNGWHDMDEVLLHAVFQTLVDFMEKEHPGKHLDWSYDKLHRQTWREIKTLYHWWKSKRPARRSPLDSKKISRPPFKFVKIEGSNLSKMVRPDKKKYAVYYRALRQDARLEKKWLEEDQRNLHRLIDIRHFLWT